MRKAAKAKADAEEKQRKQEEKERRAKAEAAAEDKQRKQQEEEKQRLAVEKAKAAAEETPAPLDGCDYVVVWAPGVRVRREPSLASGVVCVCRHGETLRGGRPGYGVA